MDQSRLGQEDDLRLQVVASYEILDSNPEPDFDQLANLATQIFQVSIATVTIADRDRHWFKSAIGLSVQEVARDVSFCTHVIQSKEPLVVENTIKDIRFENHSLVQHEPKVGFYAGVPLQNAEEVTLGTFCIMDRKPRKFGAQDLGILKTLANQVVQLLEFRRERKRLKDLIAEGRRIESQLKTVTHHLADAQRIAKVGSWELHLDDDSLYWSDETYRIFAIPKAGFGANFEAFFSRVHPDDKSRLLVAQEMTIAGINPLDIEHRIVLPDGSIRYIHERAELSLDLSMGKRVLAGTVQDITDKKLVELEREGLLERERDAAARAEKNMLYFQALFENSPGLYLVVTPDEHRILAASNAFLKARITTREAIIGSKLLDAFPANEKISSPLLASLERVTKNAEADIMPIQHYPVRTPQGELLDKYWSAVNYPVLDHEGLVAFIIHHVEDVTGYIKTHSAGLFGLDGVSKADAKPHDILLHTIEQQRFIEKIRESEERFKLVAKVTNDAIWDWNLVDNSIWWNIGMEKLFGFPLEELEPTVESWTNRIHPEDIQRVVDGIHRVINGSGNFWSDEYRFLKSDGNYAYVEDRGLVLRNASGDGVRMVGGMTDITVRKLQERKLGEQAGLLDHAKDAICVRGLDHAIHYWNLGAEKLYGYSSDEVLGKPIDELLYPDNAQVFYDANEQTFKKGYWTGRIQQTRKDGRKITVESNWSLVLDEEGKPEAIFAINTDVTEKLELEQRLLHAQKLESIGQLTGGIAHDFNNLLTVIIGNSQLLAEQLAPTPRAASLASMILTAGERGAELTQRLLAFARRQALEPRLVRIAEAVDDMKGLITRSIGEAIEIKIIHSENLWDVFVDPSHLDSVLMNLCINARDAMPEGGKITIETANVVLDNEYSENNIEVEPGPYVMVAVSDTGHGMDAKTLSSAFEPFYTTKDKGRGTGLGLSMVYGFTKQSGGHIKIYSEVGHGTLVKLYLPKAKVSDPITEDLPVASHGIGGHERILLVEDDDLLRPHAMQLLIELGYEVFTASNAAEALDAIKAGLKFDLLFTDVIMPGGVNGPQLATEAQKLLPGLPVLYTSGYTENAIVHHGRVDPGIHLLHKPYRKQTLDEKIRQALSGKKSTEKG